MFPNITLECALLNEPDPAPKFIFTFETISSNQSAPGQFNLTGTPLETPQMFTTNNGIVETAPYISDWEFMDIFYNDDVIVSITCVVSNAFGDDSATTNISVCGTTMIRVLKICIIITIGYVYNSSAICAYLASCACRSHSMSRWSNK